ncbi:hypothetical protein M569_11643 [Genlisea aurea]|uniref:BED-type domain-containing protein n=1 Tax=Genlisea aurea TaxID=192259 RepID=S8CF36_9LAMI|nr:hypothetical protein M569_11643 [Genlisea aurea]
MEPHMELVPMTSQKHDPAWKHCQMFKTEEKIHLKCIYCGKIFKGGGIHRIKEHLAGQKGNASTCLRVLPEVKQQMLDSLNGVAVKKKKKLKLTEQLSGYDNPADRVNEHSSLNSEAFFLPGPEIVEHDDDAYEEGEEGTTSKRGPRQKRPQIRKNPSESMALMSLPSVQPCSKKVHMAVGRFFVDVGLPAEAANSAYFQPMVEAIASQEAGVIGPSYQDLRSWILKNLVHETRYDVDQYANAWERTGCTVLVDDWNSGKGETFVNFFVYNSEATIFYRSANVSHGIVSADDLYELLKETVEQIGVKNVLQVITSCEDQYAFAGKRLATTYPSVFWSPCAGLCVDLMLQDMEHLPMVKVTLEQAKSISRYIYSNGFVLNMLRRHTFGLDLLDEGITPSSTNFMTLKRMLSMRHHLQSMVTSEDWIQSPHSQKPEGFALLDTMTSQSFWSACASITNLIDPLLRLLRIISSGKKPAMGYVYAGLYRAKEAIKKHFVSEDYLVYLNIIDRRWEQLQQHPLHGAGFYLNPKFFYSLEGDALLRSRSMVYDCIERLVPDPEVQDKIMKEMTYYHGGVGDFGRKMAIRARDTLLPTEWWIAYGGSCPNLSRLAVQVLSQTCGFIQLKLLDKLPLETMHRIKNPLERQRLNHLVFVHYNMRVKQLVSAKRTRRVSDPIAYEHDDMFDDWIVGNEALSVGSSGEAEWMTVDPALGVDAIPEVDDADDMGGGT